MLLIGDIHISSKIKDKLIDGIKAYIDQSCDDDIVFLGDYIYHFIYDRNAINLFFEMVIDYYLKGKNIYILAGNHDYLDGCFVFDHALKSFDILNSFNKKNILKFITTPMYEEFQEYDILFLPYSIDYVDQNYEINDKNFFDFISLLENSTNKNENISAKLNKYIYIQINNFIKKNNGKKLYIFHHYYFAGINFPGQLAKFNYKDIAISDIFLDKKDIYFISGHLHQGFAYKNYFCSGSCWNTSPLEQNQFKFLHQIDLVNSSVKSKVFLVNPYINIEYNINNTQNKNNNNSGLFDQNDLVQEKSLEKINDIPIKIDQAYLEQYILEIFNKNKDNFHGSEFDVHLQKRENFNYKLLNLIIISKDLDYETLNDCFENNFNNNIGDIKIKKSNIKIDSIMNMLDISSKDLQNSISDWKTLLKQFIIKKYGNQADLYFEKLKELKLI